jgi:hypothetical protein
VTLAEAIFIGEQITVADNNICLSSNNLDLKDIFKAIEVLTFCCKELQYSHKCISCANKEYQKNEKEKNLYSSG